MVEESMIDKVVTAQVADAIDRRRLLETATALVEVPSSTGDARAVADRLAELLAADGFEVERPVGGWEKSPAVAVRYDSGKPGRVLQLTGHLDTVHLPFVPPREDGEYLYGSGSSDMKGGIAINVEVLRVLRETGLLGGGSILLTAYDLHERPWGDGHQLEGLIEAGYVGDGVLIPEYLCTCLPVAGRGQAVFEIVISREGEKVHEVLRPADTPDVIGAGAPGDRAVQRADERARKENAPPRRDRYDFRRSFPVGGNLQSGAHGVPFVGYGGAG